MSVANIKSGQDGFWVDVQPDGNGVVEPGCYRLCVTARNDFYCFRQVSSRDLMQLIETVAVAIGYIHPVRVHVEVQHREVKTPRHKLIKEQTAKCSKCKHGRAAHVKDGKCHMKYCKCEAFHA
jgi:hypothetical protein